MKQRFITGATIIASLVLVLLTRRLTPYIFDAFIVAIAILGCYEMSNLMAKMGLYNNMYFAMAYPVFAYAFSGSSSFSDTRASKVTLFYTFLIGLYVISFFLCCCSFPLRCNLHKIKFTGFKHSFE